MPTASCMPRREATRPARRFSRNSLRVLANAAPELAGPLGWDDVVRRITTFVVPRLADWYVLLVNRPDGGVDVRAFGHWDADQRQHLGHLAEHTDPRAWTAGTLLGGVAQCNRVVWLPIIDPLQRARPTGLCPWSQRELQDLGLGSAVCVPLALAGTCLGALLLARTTAGAYDRTDVEMAIEMSRQVAILVDNARQYHLACEQVRDLEQALAVAAHELRTPTSAMSGYAQLLVRQLRCAAAPPAPSDIQYGLERIERQAQRVAALILRLLDAAQLRAGSDVRMDHQEVDLQQLVCEFSQLARASVPDRRLLVQAPEPITATLDVVRIEQVLSNLIDNAFKFSPPHTSVELSLCLVRPNVARIAVRDRGPGVAPEHRGRIFDAYYQAQGGARAGGLGLGLYLSRTIVELHGGRLLAEYPADGGSRFIIELPARRTTLSVAAAAPRPRPGTARA